MKPDTTYDEEDLYFEDAKDTSYSSNKPSIYHKINDTKTNDTKLIDIRIECLQLFENIKDTVCHITPPLFDKLTIEDLIELLYPNHVKQYYSSGV